MYIGHRYIIIINDKLVLTQYRYLLRLDRCLYKQEVTMLVFHIKYNLFTYI